ncbi:MAG: DNA-binding protein WhiA [Streptococcus sp.]|nr:DNA-binding protein WhiA [Streptococcus sp.]
MTFTADIKEELIHLSECDKPELTAIIKMSGVVGLTHSGLSLSITTENAKIARYIYESFENLYRLQPEIKYHNKTNLKKNRVYTVFLEHDVDKVLTDLKLADAFFSIDTGINPSILEHDEQGQSYLRGAFLASGSVTDPHKGKYQLEFFSVYKDHADDLKSLMNKFMLDAKVFERKNGSITYLQKAEDIMDVLLVMGAMTAKQNFEEIKIFREARNDLNRANNAETANIARTVNASMKTINNLIKIMDTIGLDSLPIELQQLARLRIENPDYSIAQLAEILDPPLTKSGVNHRLRKLNKIADTL